MAADLLEVIERTKQTFRESSSESISPRLHRQARWKNTLTRQSDFFDKGYSSPLVFLFLRYQKKFGPRLALQVLVIK